MIEYWQNLCPDLTVTANGYQLPAHETTIQDVTDNINNDGYFHVSFNDWNLPLDKMAACITTLKDNDINPTWCFVYDEFWILSTRIHSYIQSILGNNYYKLPDMWAWHIDPSNNERGWTIHRDRKPGSTYNTGAPRSLSVWIPLTAATTENSCMHIVPQSEDPNCQSTGELYYANWDESLYAGKEVAIPCNAGDIVAWNQQVLHWGGATSNTSAAPRISVGIEFADNSTQDLEDPDYIYPVKPWLDPFAIPSFNSRVDLINSFGAKVTVTKYDR